MIRFKFAVSSVLLGSLMASPVAIGQEPPKAEGQAASEAQARAEYEEQYRAASEARARAKAAKEQILAELNQLRAQEAHANLSGQQTQALAKVDDPLETNFGLSLADADETLRSQLEIPAGQGVVVIGVKAGSLAEQAGLKLNDVLLSLGAEKATTEGQVRKILLGLGKEALEVKLIREGKPSRMSLVGPEHGFPPEAAEYWIGVPVSPVDATLRSHLPTLPADSGLIVNDVVKGSPADQASVNKDDVLVAMDGKPLRNADALIAQIQASQGKPVPLQVLRAGKPLTITVTPAKRAHPTVINLNRSPDAAFTYQVVRPNMAIEVDPRSPAVKEPGQIKPVEAKPWLPETYTLYAPYVGYESYIGALPLAVRQGSVYRQPYPSYENSIGILPTNPYLPFAAEQATGLQFPQPSLRPTVDAPIARIEGQLKEVMAKLDAINKSLEELKKPAGK